MKLIVTALAAVLLATSGAGAQTLEDLKNDGKNPDNILTYGMGTTSSATASSIRSTHAR